MQLNFKPKPGTPAAAPVQQVQAPAPAAAPATRPAFGAPARMAAPVVQAPRSIFSGIETVEAAFGANYVKDGNYFFLIRGTKQGANKSRRPNVIFELTVLQTFGDTLGKSSTPGSEVSYVYALNESFLRNIKAAIANIAGCDPATLTEQQCDQVITTNAFGGMFVEADVNTIITKGKQMPFARIEFKRRISAMEVASNIDEAIAKKVFGENAAEVLTAMVEAEQAQG